MRYLAFIPLIVGAALIYRYARPKPAPDAVSAGWAYYVNNQVAQRDNECAAYLKWVRSL